MTSVSSLQTTSNKVESKEGKESSGLKRNGQFHYEFEGCVKLHAGNKRTGIYIALKKAMFVEISSQLNSEMYLQKIHLEKRLVLVDFSNGFVTKLHIHKEKITEIENEQSEIYIKENQTKPGIVTYSTLSPEFEITVYEDDSYNNILNTAKKTSGIFSSLLNWLAGS